MNFNKFIFFVYCIDEFGFIHKKNIYNWVHPNENSAILEPAIPAQFEGELIFDKNGNILYGKETW